MTETLYEKVYYLDLECVAVWDDFDGPGAWREYTTWKEKKGPFTEEKAREEWDVFCEYVNNTERETLRKTHNISSSRISRPSLEGDKDFYPTDFYFKHTIKEEFKET